MERWREGHLDMWTDRKIGKWTEEQRRNGEIELMDIWSDGQMDK